MYIHIFFVDLTKNNTKEQKVTTKHISIYVYFNITKTNLL